MSVTEEASTAPEATTGDNQNTNGDEQGMSLTGTPPLSDPAILAVNPKFRYGKEELLKLREAPLSQRKPDFLDINEVSPTIWDPTRWNSDRKKSDTPVVENGTKSSGGGDVPDHRRRPGDPRERIRKENDGIVLSPQRRSFNSGCFVPVRETRTSNGGGNRPHSPLGGKGDGSSHGGGLGGGRDIQTSSSRRIGSGRILRDTWDFTEKPDGVADEYSFRPQTGPPESGRRSFGRDFDSVGGGRGDKEKEKSGRSGSRFGGGGNDRRRTSGGRTGECRDEEPEWFSGGPSSQNDTIELRGFDENERLGGSAGSGSGGGGGKKKMSPSQAKRARDWFKKKNEVSSVAEEKNEDIIEGGGQPGGRSTPTPQAGGGEGNATSNQNEKEQNGSISSTATSESAAASVTTENETSEADKQQQQQQQQQKQQQQQQEKNMSDQSYIFEDILKSDTIPGLPGLLTNGVGGDGDSNAKSRFSKWFSSIDTTANNVTESRRSSTQEESIIKNILKDLGEPTVSIPGDSNSYFAPISPAANTGGPTAPLSSTGGAGGGMPANSKSINIMEMLQRSKQNEQVMKPQVPGRILNLNELEAKMRQNSEPPPMHKNPQKSEEDLQAFNRLLAHLSVNHTATSNGPMPPKMQPMSLMEMLSHSQQQDEAHARMAQLLGPASPGASPHDLASRLQHVQNQQQQKQQQVEMLTKLMNAQMQVRASPLPEMGLQQSRELLSRPEAQAILQGLKIGDITPQHLYQQLANPALQPRHREMLVTILKLQGAGGAGAGAGPSPRVLSPVGPHPMFQQQQQQQQLRVSPLPPNAIHQRIPSPRELQVHTQNILQRALIKKKLEEQQENYRKKQEMQQRGQSPNNNNNNNTSATNANSSGGNNNNSGGQQQQQPAAAKSVSSPTPLAFTPTSVLRKMTAEKDEGGKDVTKLVDGGKLTQGRAVTGMRPQSQQQQQQSQQQQQQQQIGQWPPFPLNIKQAGRPIVKANTFQSAQQQQQEHFYNQQQQQQKFLNQLQQQQQQARKYQGAGGNGPVDATAVEGSASAAHQQTVEQPTTATTTATGKRILATVP